MTWAFISAGIAKSIKDISGAFNWAVESSSVRIKLDYYRTVSLGEML